MKGDTEILVITGMSGAGRSTVAHTLEDLGWYVVDNLPPALLRNLIDLVNVSVKKVAVVVDVRGRAFFDDLTKSLAELAKYGPSEGEEKCGNCEYGKKLPNCGMKKGEVYCEKFDFRCSEKGVCDAWEPMEEDE